MTQRSNKKSLLKAKKSDLVHTTLPISSTPSESALPRTHQGSTALSRATWDLALRTMGCIRVVCTSSSRTKALNCLRTATCRPRTKETNVLTRCIQKIIYLALLSSMAWLMQSQWTKTSLTLLATPGSLVCHPMTNWKLQKALQRTWHIVKC